MKKIMVVCGSGIATSTIAMSKVKEWIKKENLENQVKLYQSSIQGTIGNLSEYDVVISTTVVPDNVKSQVVDGVCLLTGIGVDKLFHEVKEKLGI